MQIICVDISFNPSIVGSLCVKGLGSFKIKKNEKSVECVYCRTVLTYLNDIIDINAAAPQQGLSSFHVRFKE